MISKIDEINREIQSSSQQIKNLRIMIDIATEKYKLFYDVLYKDEQIKDAQLQEKRLHDEFNLLGLLVSAKLDSLTIVKHLLLSTEDWEKRYFLNKYLLLVHETINTYDANAITIYNLADELGKQKEHKLTSERLKQIKKNHSKDISHVRNNCAAHTNTKFTAYYDAVISLKEEDYLEISKLFSVWIADVISLYYELHSISTKLVESDLESKAINAKKKLEHLINYTDLSPENKQLLCSIINKINTLISKTN